MIVKRGRKPIEDKGQSITAWLPGSLLEQLTTYSKTTNQSRSLAIVELVRAGLTQKRKSKLWQERAARRT